jgi:hypothetical protein
VTAFSTAALERQGASPEEAAAILIAILRFARDTAPPPRRRNGRSGGWLRAGRLEDVGGSAEDLSAWGDPHPWGSYTANN